MSVSKGPDNEVCTITEASSSPSSPQAQTSPTSTSTSKISPVHCPKCKKPCRRRQDLRRHIMSIHLPCWIYCPYSRCSWRGNRKDKFRKHLSVQKCGSKPEDKLCQIYDSKMITNWILKDQVPAGVGASYALVFVGEKAKELRKVEDWEDLWGGKGRKVVDATQPPALVRGPA